MADEATQTQLDELARQVNDRVGALRNRTNEQIRDAGERGPSVPTISKIRNAKGPTPNEKSLELLDDGLGWERGSAFDVLWHGRSPRARTNGSSGDGLRLTTEQRDGLLGALRNIRESADEAVKILGG